MACDGEMALIIIIIIIIIIVLTFMLIPNPPTFLLVTVTFLSWAKQINKKYRLKIVSKKSRLILSQFDKLMPVKVTESSANIYTKISKIYFQPYAHTTH